MKLKVPVSILIWSWRKINFYRDAHSINCLGYNPSLTITNIQTYNVIIKRFVIKYVIISSKLHHNKRVNDSCLWEMSTVWYKIYDMGIFEHFVLISCSMCAINWQCSVVDNWNCLTRFAVT